MDQKGRPTAKTETTAQLLRNRSINGEYTINGITGVDEMFRRVIIWARG